MASEAAIEKAGNEAYRDDHLGKIFQEGFSFSGYERDAFYLNLGTKDFLNISGISGIDSITDGRGAVFADFDNDGDTDVFLTTIQGQAHLLFKNNVGQEKAFVRISLEGTKSGKDAYGAIVRAKTSAGILTKLKAGASGYLSQSDPRLVFGLGNDAKAKWIEVTWPSGLRQRFENVQAGTSLKIVEGKPTYEALREKRFELPAPLSKADAFLSKLKLKPATQFPDLKLSSLKGESHTLSEILTPGHRYFINIWATYCVPCTTEMPELQRLYERFQENRIELVGLSLDATGPTGMDMKQTRQKVKKFLKQHGIAYPIYLADHSLINQVYATDEAFIPLSFMIDDQGKILQAFSGWSKESLDELRALAQNRRPATNEQRR